MHLEQSLNILSMEQLSITCRHVCSIDDVRSRQVTMGDQALEIALAAKTVAQMMPLPLLLSRLLIGRRQW